MTTSAESTFEFDISKIVRMAFQVAGLMSPEEAATGMQWQKRAAMAMDFLEVTTKALQAQGIFVRPIDFYDLPVVAGTAKYLMPPETLDLIGIATFLASDETTGETAVFPIQRDQYMRYATKDSEGRPSQYYADRQLELNVYLYTTPSEDGRVRFQRHRLLANSRNGANTVDLERHWTKYLIYELGKDLARNASLPMNVIRDLAQDAQVALALAKGYSKERGPQQMRNMHRTGWNR